MMDLRSAELVIDSEVFDRMRAAERFQIQLGVPAIDRIASSVNESLGHLLIRAGRRLESAACQGATVHGLTPLNPDPCHGCAN
jgi:hypothetical protein